MLSSVYEKNNMLYTYMKITQLIFFPWSLLEMLRSSKNFVKIGRLPLYVNRWYRDWRSLVTDYHYRHPKGPRSQAQTSC